MKSILAICLLALCSCALSTTQHVVREEQQQPDCLGDSTIAVAKDSILKINFLIHPGTGYSWVLMDTAFNLLKYQGQTFSPTSQEDSGSGIQTFLFLARRAGMEDINFVYKQPFIKITPATAPQKKYCIKIM